MATTKAIEEKARLYDEAIRKAKDMLSYKEIKQEDIEYLFPELKESEDERIMGAFRDFAENYLFWEKSGLTKEKAIAWLEKQGEQKPADSKIIDLDELVIELEETIGTSPHSRETIKDFFKRAVQKYMNCLKIANGEIGSLVEENYRLKEKQGEQNPAWSKEDEEIIEALISLCDEAQDNIPQLSALKNWLKSLKNRCTWKPSELQIEALVSAIDVMIDNRGAGDKNTILLSGLYHKLKELMEE